MDNKHSIQILEATSKLTTSFEKICKDMELTRIQKLSVINYFKIVHEESYLREDFQDTFSLMIEGLKIKGEL